MACAIASASPTTAKETVGDFRLWEYECCRYYTEPQLAALTNIVLGIEQGALYAEVELHLLDGATQTLAS
jgi:hypothetical protein